MGTLLEDHTNMNKSINLCKLMIISCRMLLTTRNISDKSREKQNTHFISKTFFLKIVPFMR
jgi:hypothetical protein